MNWSRFSNPANEPQDPDERDEVESEKADNWHDQAVDRERQEAEEKQDRP